MLSAEIIMTFPFSTVLSEEVKAMFNSCSNVSFVVTTPLTISRSSVSFAVVHLIITCSPAAIVCFVEA